MEQIFFANIQKGKILFSDSESFKWHIYSLEGIDVDVIVRKHKKDRTNQQNKWYWSCIVGIPAKHYSYLPEEMHDAYKMMFLRNHIEGKPETLKSTAKLSTVEFTEYIEKCIQWCSENGLVIPNPDSVFID